MCKQGNSATFLGGHTFFIRAMLHSEKWGKFSVFKSIGPGLYLLKDVVTARCCYRFAEDCLETKQELQCA